MNLRTMYRWKGVPVLFFLTLTLGSWAFSQATYRTFNQVDLAGKKAKAGKVLASNSCFVFRNDSTGITVNSLHGRLNSGVNRILDSGGFTTFTFDRKHKVFDATGRTVLAGDSVTLCFELDKKASGAQANFWWWDTNGVRVGSQREPVPGTYTAIQIEPNGGNVLEVLYKRVIKSKNGLIVGYPTDTPNVGWIRYKTADRKYFPHTDSSRCFDYIIAGRGNRHAFIGEIKNPHVNKHNNHLLGELHALKLAVVANDSGITQPDTGTALGDLIYNDLLNPSDPANNLTIRGLIALTDSALTYCGHFVASDYFALDSSVSRINRAFDGPYVAISFNPLVLAGTNPLPAFLHPNPAITPGVVRHASNQFGADEPESVTLYQNYPNPFNPTTTIEFTLPQASLVTLKVYNLLGQEVETLLNKSQMDGGQQSVHFDASRIASGVYFYRIIAQSTDGATQTYQAVKRMIVMK